MTFAALNTPLLRRLLRAVWMVALIAVPLTAPGIDGAAYGHAWVHPAYRALLGLLLFVSTPLMGVMMLAAIELYHLYNRGGDAPLITLYAAAAIAALLLAWRNCLLAHPPWLLPVLLRFLRPLMLPMFLFAVLPLYFSLCSPWPVILLGPWCLLLWAAMPRQQSLPRHLAGAVAGASAALLLFMATIEMGARMGFSPHPPNLLLRAHPTRIVDLVPHASGAFRFDEFQSAPFRATISSQGLRDVEYPAKPAGTLRVLALGDSTTFGWGVAPEHTLPKQLESFLRDTRGTDALEVLNAGTPTYGPWQSLDWLRERAEEFEPDVILYSLFPINDAANELYRVGKQLRCYYPEQVAAMRRMQRAGFPPERLDYWLHRHSRAYQLLIHARPRSEHPVISLASHLRIMEGDFFPPLPPPEPGEPGMELNRAVWYPELEESIVLVMETIENMRAYCDSNGWRFAVLLLPSGLSISRAAYEDAARRCPWGVASFDAVKELSIFQQRLAEAGIPMATPRDRMAAAPDPSIYHLPDDGHLSPEGNLVAAQTAAALLEQVWPQ